MPFPTPCHVLTSPSTCPRGWTVMGKHVRYQRNTQSGHTRPECLLVHRHRGSRSSAGVRLLTTITDTEGTAFMGKGQGLCAPGARAQSLHARGGHRACVLYQKRSFLCDQLPKEQKLDQQGLLPKEMLPSIRQAWVWPAPGHPHT